MGNERVRMQAGDPIPYRGDIPIQDQDDPWWMKPQPIADAKMRIFDFSDEDDLKDYNEILDRVAKEMAGFGHCEFHFDDETGCWKGLVHWYELHKESPESIRKKKLTT